MVGPRRPAPAEFTPMITYSRSHLSDPVLLRDLATHLKQERGAIAEVLADLAEVDARKLYAPSSHPSMYSYCVQELGFSDDAAYKRIQAARAARQFPAIFSMLANGQLHLCGVCLLSPHLKPDNADELLGAAAG